MTPLVVFSHLRWSFVRQRPRHLMTRLAAHYDIRFIEEPQAGDGIGRLAVRHVAPGVTVLAPQLAEPGGFLEAPDAGKPKLPALLAAAAREHGLRDALVWLTTPLALPLAEALAPRLVIYDCMDDLAALDGAPPELGRLEDQLLARADLVFTGGPALYESRRRRHAHVQCLPDAVDASHFSPAGLDPADPQAAQADELQQALPRPRLGFFGVIDERLDLGLLAHLADARPAWQIVMAGPVIGIDAAALPQRPNIHWLGLQPYGRLPYLMAGWDLCLMPYALNDATRLISPTKTLEYLAGEKPVVSTPLPDVVLMYGSVVRTAHGCADFIAACEATLAETRRERSRRVMEMLTTVSTHSWDRTALMVHQQITQALAQREEEAAVMQAPPVAVYPAAARLGAAPG
ncbi:glycosyltransferase family 1 protein [Aquincola sp. S2]|uniref:Glycosyltransferase family 1 protein n=1 Tax=Pseudaquabacterium terrae TaxID=2732868 RepID=A0ABX2EHV6_9BURK|nr:glycosyltransferase family 1 protein [Aquabacterium terrae]NRF68204.1 glycosyltransferase family 1 protein [Aquabacterium terrae]